MFGAPPERRTTCFRSNSINSALCTVCLIHDTWSSVLPRSPYHVSNVRHVTFDVATSRAPPRRPPLPLLRFHTNVVVAPPRFHVLVPHGVLLFIGGVGHSAHAAPELGVDEVACPLPPEVVVVEGVVGVEFAQIGSEFARRREVVDVDVRARWRHLAVVLWRRTHHHRYDIVAATANAYYKALYVHQLFKNRVTSIIIVCTAQVIIVFYYSTCMFRS